MSCEQSKYQEVKSNKYVQQCDMDRINGAHKTQEEKKNEKEIVEKCPVNFKRATG